MIEGFCVYNRGTIEHVATANAPHVIVSITTPGDPHEARLPVGELTLAVLRLSFHDMDSDHLTHCSDLTDDERRECFTKAQAREIIDLVAGHPSAKLLIVHCDAGLSRSPAVAAAVSKALTGDDSTFFKRYSPNMLVYKTILQEYYDGDGDHRDQGG